MGILFICFLVLITGACIGSFLNVVALRALSGESIVFPSSKCPKCSNPIKWYDNIPVLSYLFTFKGKCRNCGEKVSLQYPVIEALTAVLFLFTVISFGFSIQALLTLILLCISIVISITDIKEEVVFVHHTIILAVFALITSLYVNGLENFKEPLLGLIAAAAAMEIVARVSYYFLPKKDDENDEITNYVETKKRAFGEGDTYIAAAIGALLGWKLALISMFGAVILQALFILPKFFIELYNQKYYKLITAFVLFAVLSIIYNFFAYTFNFYTVIAYNIGFILIAIYIILNLRNSITVKGFIHVPFGPALLVSAFIAYFLFT